MFCVLEFSKQITSDVFYPECFSVGFIYGDGLEKGTIERKVHPNFCLER